MSSTPEPLRPTFPASGHRSAWQALSVPVFELVSDGTIVFANHAAEAHWDLSHVDFGMSQFATLVDEQDLISITGLDSIFASLPTTFNTRLKSRSGSAQLMTFTAQSLETSDTVLLIGHPSAEILELASSTSRELSKATNEISDLEVRVFKQTAKLASESDKRAQAEEKARLEAESKISLVSSAIHHLNNPLNHIEGSRAGLESQIEIIRSTITHLLQTEDDDPAAQALLHKFNEEFESTLFNIATIRDAASRITNTVDLLRVVSGVDGWAKTPTTVGAVCEIGSNRLTGPVLMQLMKLNKEFGSTRLLGHPSLYAHAIDRIESSLGAKKLSSSGLGVAENDTTCHLIWHSITSKQSGSDNTPVDAMELKALFADTIKEIEYLLSQYGVSLKPLGSELHLVLPRPSY